MEPQATENPEMKPQVNASKRKSEIDEIAAKVVQAAYAVANTLGVGFLEKVYENALAHELRLLGLRVIQQAEIKVRYKGVVVGDYLGDLLVEDTVLVELKVARTLDDIHRAQCMNYLRATDLPLCLLINFGNPVVEVRRIAHKMPKE